VHSVGGLLSGLIANSVVVWASYSTAFLLLATIAALGGTLFWLVMPETRGCGAGGLSQSATDAPLKG
jgi:hypothetical protein